MTAQHPLPLPLEKLVLQDRFLDFCDEVLENEWKMTGHEKLEIYVDIHNKVLGRRGGGRDYEITGLRMEKVFHWESFW